MTRKFIIIGILVIQALISSTAVANDLTYISLPVSIDLAALEQKANARLPKRLATINKPNEICIKETRVEYDYPCFYHWKWKTCRGWTKGTPAVRCDITGYVDKLGPLKILGTENTFDLSLPVHASVTAKAGVRQTVTADATFFVKATPWIDETWQPQISVSADYRWDKRPSMKLFNIIKISLGSVADGPVQNKLKDVEELAKNELAKLDIRTKVEAAWADLQKPIQVHDQPATFLTFTPTQTGYSGIKIVNKTVHMQLHLAGTTNVIAGVAPTVTPVPLLPLEPMEIEDPSFRLNLPITVTGNALQEALETHLPDGIKQDIATDLIKGTFKARNLQMAVSSAAGIHLKANVSFREAGNWWSWLRWLDIFGWFDIKGTAEIKIVPTINTQTQTITAEALQLDSETNNELADVLIDLLNLDAVQQHLLKSLQYEYGDDIDSAVAKAQTALNRPLGDAGQLIGEISAADVEALEMDDHHFTIRTRTEGKVEIQL